MASRNSDAEEFENVVEVVRRWSVSKRLALLEEILKTLRADERARLARDTWAEASGLLRGPEATLTEKEVERLLDESRSDKHR